MTDFSLFRGGDPTPQNANNRLVLVGVKHGSNAAILVGMCWASRIWTISCPPRWTWSYLLGGSFHDSNGKLWRKLSVRDLLGDEIS
ncbi:MAG: hypothetical protein IPJ99_01455 [Betaproteobacteria bacterium]|nr:hypothetical protein [Betaproteobacteria bacterium]